MCFVNQKPIHVVIAIDDITNNCIVITYYKPNPGLQDTSFNSKFANMEGNRRFVSRVN
jgi:hypothetical protein